MSLFIRQMISTSEKKRHFMAQGHASRGHRSPAKPETLLTPLGESTKGRATPSMSAASTTGQQNKSTVMLLMISLKFIVTHTLPVLCNLIEMANEDIAMHNW